MTPADIADVLSAAAAYDGRTIGMTDVSAWHRAIGDHDRDDALEAVVRHYRTETRRLMPADITKLAQEIRNERAAAQHHEIRALPSRFEADEIRDKRVRAGVRRLSAMLAVPADLAGDPDDPHARAVARARRERGKRPIPGADRRKPSAKPIDVGAVAGPEWADEHARERESVLHLHQLGRDCGRASCRTCRERAR